MPVEANQFTIVNLPSCAPCKGRVYSFTSNAEAQGVLIMFSDLASEGTSEFHWVYGRDNVVVLLDNDVPEEWARGYRSALQTMGD